MNCSEAQAHLTHFSLSSASDSESLSREQLAAEQHVAACPACRQALHQEAIVDREISARMTFLPIPKGLAQRIQQQFPARQVVPPDRSRTRRGRRFWLGTALLLAIVCTLSFWMFSPKTLSTDELLTIIRQTPSVENWPTDASPQLPLGWMQIPQLATESARWNPAAAVKLQAWAFRFRSNREGTLPVSGTLWRVAADHFRDSEALLPLGSAEIRYEANFAWLLWRENSSVYLVTLEGRALNQLQNALSRHRSLS